MELEEEDWGDEEDEDEDEVDDEGGVVLMEGAEGEEEGAEYGSGVEEQSVSLLGLLEWLSLGTHPHPQSALQPEAHLPKHYRIIPQANCQVLIQKNGIQLSHFRGSICTLLLSLQILRLV